MSTQDGWDWPNGWQDEGWPALPVEPHPRMPMLVLPVGVPEDDLRNLRPGKIIRLPHWPE